MRDDVVGFHAQQAVEKVLKVALVLADIDFPRSHDLRELADIAADNSIAVPEFDPRGALADAVGGTATLRDAGALDRDAAFSIAADAVEWAAGLLSG